MNTFLSLFLIGGTILLLLPKTKNYMAKFKFGFGIPTKDWWIKIKTHSPKCTYFFGPFDSVGEAEGHESGFLEDLNSEGALDISVDILRCHQKLLTIEEA